MLDKMKKWYRYIVQNNIIDFKEFLDNIEDVNCKDWDGTTPLMLAVYHNRPDMVYLLLLAGADPNIQSIYGKTALDIAKTPEMKRILNETTEERIVNLIKENFTNLAIKLIDESNANYIIKEGNITFLMWASYRNNIEIATHLLNKGANPNIKDNIGKTALIIACSWNYIKMATLLLNNGANPNIKDFNGATALHYTGIKNSPDLITLLLNNGADPNAIDNSGNKPIDYLPENLKYLLSKYQEKYERYIDF